MQQCSVPSPPRTPIAALQVVRFTVHLFKGTLELAPCLKHDLTWNGLQGIEGGTSVDEEGNTTTEDDKDLDSAWGPRNKFLSDAQFLIDHLCKARTGNTRRDCVTDNGDYWTAIGGIGWLLSDAKRLPRVLAWGVAEVNDIHWPVTDADIEHARTNPSYMKCDVPRLEEFDFTLSSNRRFYNVSADPVKGCVSDITITEYHWQPSQRVWFSPNPSVDFDPESFTIPAANTKIRITLKPANQKYGGERYLQYRGVPE